MVSPLSLCVYVRMYVLYVYTVCMCYMYVCAGCLCWMYVLDVCWIYVLYVCSRCMYVYTYCACIMCRGTSIVKNNSSKGHNRNYLPTKDTF